ncbi:AMOP domain-containing protein [Balamuthia mandrillaris]
MARCNLLPAPLLCLCLLMVGLSHAWPGMRTHSKGGPSRPIGPDCTVGAHTVAQGPCPNMPQPPPPSGSVGDYHFHHWPSAFQVSWEFFFVPDDKDVPPYLPLPKTAYNRTTGRTFYQVFDESLGLRNMRESYDKYCIPVFGDPTSSMGSRNDFSCDFINVGVSKTAFVVLHEDRPAGAPECCIIGRPFHPPPQDFARGMPVKWRDNKAGAAVDWNAVWDKDAGIFNYGFQGTDSEVAPPFAFYMKGVPWIANWMWQRFSNFSATTPDPSVWNLPPACFADGVGPCPGW